MDCCVRQCHASAQATWQKLEEKRVEKNSASVLTWQRLKPQIWTRGPLLFTECCWTAYRSYLTQQKHLGMTLEIGDWRLESLQEMSRQITAATKPSNTAEALWTLPESLAASPAMSNSSSHQPCPLLTLWQQHNLNSYNITDSLSQDSPYKQQQLVGEELPASSQAKVLVCRKLRLNLIIQYST